MICQVKREKASHAPGFYDKLLTFENQENEHRIQKDVDRTFNNYEAAGIIKNIDSWNQAKSRKMLFNVLLAYANYDFEIGYVQGMNYIAAMLLMYIEDEERVFWCIIYLLSRKNWRQIYIEEMPKLMELIAIVENKLDKQYPQVAQHLEEQCFTVSAAFSPLFITLYIYQIEHQYAMRIFEYFLLDGEEGLLHVLYKMLDFKADKLCTITEMELLIYLRTDLIKECITEYGVSSLFI